jgi:ankyrin repeat protein
LLEDLRPYICTYLECSTANELYGSRQDWLAHEQQVHRQFWQCRDHNNKPFASEAEFQAHLASKHQSMNLKEVEAFSELARVAVDDTRSHCPICLVDVAQLPEPQSLFHHTANHFETFATFALPCNLSSDADDVSEGSNKVIVDFEASERDVDSDMNNDWHDDLPESPDQGIQGRLRDAAARGDLYLLHGLLRHDTDTVQLNSKDQEGWTALQRAAVAGHKEAAQLLIENGADVNARGSEFGNALQAAAARGHADIVRLLLRHSAALNARGGRYSTALQAAAQKGHLEVVQILLDAQPHQDGGTFLYQDAIEVASKQGHMEIMQILQEAQNRQGPTPSPESEFSNTASATQGSKQDKSLEVRGRDTTQLPHRRDLPHRQDLDPSMTVLAPLVYIR